MKKNKFAIVICFVLGCLSASAQSLVWSLKPEYEIISEFNEGIAAVRKNGKWGYISENGREILAPAYDAAFPFHEGMAVLTDKDYMLVAILNQSGKLIPIEEKLQIDSRFAVFSDGLLLVSDGKKKGYLNKDGQISIDCRFDFAQPFSEGLAAAVLDSRQCYCWYYIDTKGRPVFHLSDLKKNIYWALGFHEGKALVLHSKGALFVNNRGKEQPQRLPQITPPDDAIHYSKESLVCKEGILTFDNLCRAVSFISKTGIITEFMPSVATIEPALAQTAIVINGTSLAKEDVKWLNSSTAVVKTNDSKYGILKVLDKPALAFSLSVDTLIAATGNSATTYLNIRNNSQISFEKMEIMVNENTHMVNALTSGGSASLELSFEKTTGSEIESKDISITAWSNGLQVGESEKTIWIKNDLPSLSISVPASKVTIRVGQNTYSIGVQVRNLSDNPVSNIRVTVDRQTQTIAYLSGGESATVQFSFNSPNASIVRTFSISAAPPDAPPVTASARVAIDVSLPPPPTF